jgi:hypothetical protein
VFAKRPLRQAQSSTPTPLANVGVANDPSFTLRSTLSPLTAIPSTICQSCACLTTDPTSTNFGRVTEQSASLNRFFQIQGRLQF